jgi:putative membrane protein
MKIFVHWIVYALAIAIAAYLLPGITVTGGATTVLVLAVVLSLINTFVRPVLLLLTLPLSILTLGIFTLFLNAFLILIAARLVSGFDVASFWSAFFFGIVLALVHAVLHRFEKKAA